MVSIFSLLKAVFCCFSFSIHKIADSKYSIDIYKSSKISIGTVMKNPELLKLVPNHLKTNKMCKNAVEKLSLVKRYVPDHYKIQ